MLQENELIGLFSLYRQEVRPFTDRQITLKQFPAYLNRWDSQQARNEGVSGH
jgi:hypothetical protein